MHFKAPSDWFETNSRHQERYSGRRQKIRRDRSLLGRVIRLTAQAEQIKEFRSLYACAYAYIKWGHAATCGTDNIVIIHRMRSILHMRTCLSLCFGRPRYRYAYARENQAKRPPSCFAVLWRYRTKKRVIIHCRHAYCACLLHQPMLVLWAFSLPLSLCLYKVTVKTRLLYFTSEKYACKRSKGHCQTVDNDQYLQNVWSTFETYFYYTHSETWYFSVQITFVNGLVTKL